jgi:hypothetical protein
MEFNDKGCKCNPANCECWKHLYRDKEKNFMQLRDKQYLGDGVYASFDGDQIWLATGNHDHNLADNVIALEAQVFDALNNYKEMLIEKYKAT